MSTDLLHSASLKSLVEQFGSRRDDPDTDRFLQSVRDVARYFLSDRFVETDSFKSSINSLVDTLIHRSVTTEALHLLRVCLLKYPGVCSNSSEVIKDYLRTVVSTTRDINRAGEAFSCWLQMSSQQRGHKNKGLESFSVNFNGCIVCLGLLLDRVNERLIDADTPKLSFPEATTNELILFPNDMVGMDDGILLGCIGGVSIGLCSAFSGMSGLASFKCHLDVLIQLIESWLTVYLDNWLDYAASDISMHITVHLLMILRCLVCSLGFLAGCHYSNSICLVLRSLELPSSTLDAITSLPSRLRCSAYAFVGSCAQRLGPSKHLRLATHGVLLSAIVRDLELLDVCVFESSGDKDSVFPTSSGQFRSRKRKHGRTTTLEETHDEGDATIEKTSVELFQLIYQRISSATECAINVIESCGPACSADFYRKLQNTVVVSLLSSKPTPTGSHRSLILDVRVAQLTLFKTLITLPHPLCPPALQPAMLIFAKYANLGDRCIDPIQVQNISKLCHQGLSLCATLVRPMVVSYETDTTGAVGMTETSRINFTCDSRPSIYDDDSHETHETRTGEMAHSTGNAMPEGTDQDYSNQNKVDNETSNVADNASIRCTDSVSGKKTMMNGRRSAKTVSFDLSSDAVVDGKTVKSELTKLVSNQNSGAVVSQQGDYESIVSSSSDDDDDDIEIIGQGDGKVDETPYVSKKTNIDVEEKLGACGSGSIGEVLHDIDKNVSAGENTGMNVETSGEQLTVEAMLSDFVPA